MLAFNVKNQIIERIDNFHVVADSKNYLSAKFSFSEEWTGEIRAVFGNDGKFYDVSVEDNSCMVPWEVIKPPFFTVSLFCGEESLVTANVMTIEVEKSGMAEGEVPSTPTPTVWQQYIASMQEIIDRGLPYVGENGNWFLYNAEECTYKDTGTSATGPKGEQGIQGEKGEQGEKGDKGEKGDAPQKGIDYWTEEDKSDIKLEATEGISASIKELARLGWRNYQEPTFNGNNPCAGRTNYDACLLKESAKHFYPAYDIKPTTANRFARDMVGEKINLVERLAECGVALDFSACTNMTYLFYQCKFTHIPEIDARNAGVTISYVSFGSNVETIDKLIIKDDGSQNLNGTFGYANGLIDIVVEGVIGGNIFDVHWSTKLSRASIESFIGCLHDKESGGTATFSLAAVNKAFESAEGLADGSISEAWTSLINTKPYWTVSLV